jgi:trimeric autotransporter adhesin
MLPLVLFLAFCDFTLAFPKLPGFNLLPGKRNVFEERQAEAQPTCSCDSVDPVASAFISHAPFAAAASAAPTPSGYVNAFTNENSYCNAEGGLGFTTLDTYDSELCADLCKSVEGCTAFTLYYEKDATTNYRGTDVGSSALIKCAFWSGSLAPRGSSSRGSDAYNAVVAGSNGYNQRGPNAASTAASGTGVGGQGGSASTSIISTSPGWTDGHGGSHGSGSASSTPTTSGSPAAGASHGSWPGGHSTSNPTTVQGTYTHSSTASSGAHGYTGGWPVTTSSSSHAYTTSSSHTSSSITSALSSSNPAPSNGYSFQIINFDTKRGKRDVIFLGFYDGSAVEVDTLAEAATFQLQDGQLKMGDSYIGTDSSSGYEAMVLFDEAPKISDGWKIGSGQTLEFHSHDFTFGGGQAGFCTSTYGSLYIEFTDEPSFICNEVRFVGVAPASVSTTTSGTSSTSSSWTVSGSLSTSSTTHSTSSLLTTASSTPGWPGQAGSHGIGHRPTTTKGQPYSTTPSWSLTTTIYSSTTSSPLTSSTTSSSSTSSTTHSTSSLLTTASSTPGWSGSHGIGHRPTTTKGQLYSTTPSWSLTTTTHSSTTSSTTTSSSSSTTASTVAEPTGSTNESYSGNSTYGGGIPPIFLNSTHLIYNATTNMVYCEWTGLWYPYTANFSLASLNLTSGWNYTLPSNTTDSVNATSTSITSALPTTTDAPTTRSALPSNTTTASPTETSASTSNGTDSGNSTYGGGYGNFTIPPIFLNSTHLIYNATTNMVYCEWTGLWYPYTANFSLASLNWTSAVNYTLPSNTTDVVNVTSTSTTSELPSSTTTSSPTGTSAPVSNTTTYNNSTGYPIGYNTSIPWHMTWNPSNQSWYCNLTGLWYPSGANFSIPGYNFTEPSNSTEVNATTSTVSSTTSSATPSPTPSDVVSPDNTTSNYTGSPSGYNFTGMPFNMSHMVYNPSNNSWYCELTHLWYPADGNWSLSDFNITLPSYNYTLNGTYPAANTTTSSIVADATSTGSPTSTSSTPADPTETASNSTGVTDPSYNATGTWSIADFNSSHLIYSASNNSIFCTITGLWYPAGNFSLASLNLTGNWTDSSYGSNYTLPSNTTAASNSSSTSVGPSETSTTTSSETPSATPAPDNSTTSLNGTGVTYPSFNYSSIPFNESHFIYNPGNDSLYCELTGLW